MSSIYFSRFYLLDTQTLTHNQVCSVFDAYTHWPRQRFTQRISSGCPNQMTISYKQCYVPSTVHSLECILETMPAHIASARKWFCSEMIAQNDYFVALYKPDSALPFAQLFFGQNLQCIRAKYCRRQSQRRIQ